MQAGELAGDVEVADLAEVEELLVERGPLVHAPAADVVGQVVDVVQAGAARMRVAPAGPVEIDVVDRALRAVAVDEIDLQAADALDRRDGELHRSDLGLRRLRAHGDGALVGLPGVDDAEGHRRRRGPVLGGKPRREGLRLAR